MPNVYQWRKTPAQNPKSRWLLRRKEEKEKVEARRKNARRESFGGCSQIFVVCSGLLRGEKPKTSGTASDGAPISEKRFTMTCSEAEAV